MATASRGPKGCIKLQQQNDNSLLMLLFLHYIDQQMPNSGFVQTYQYCFPELSKNRQAKFQGLPGPKCCAG